MTPRDPVERFRISMIMDFDMWHDGTGYDLQAIADANDEEKNAMAAMVIPPKGWRDVEALAALDTSASRDAMRAALTSKVAEVRTAASRYAAPDISDKDREKVLVRAIRTGAFYQDMTSALQQIESFHPPAVVNAMFRALFTQSGDVACHLAAMLTFVHGKAESSFDWNHRPLFLRFNTDDAPARLDAFHDLCVLLEIDERATLKRAKVKPV